MQWCGVCVSCRTGHFNQCEKIELLGFSAPGAFATYAAVNEKYCWDLTELRKVYKEEDQLFEAAALMEPLGCAYNALFVEGGGITPGAYVVVHGAGPIGLATIMLAKACGAAKIIAFDLSEERNQLALAIGADYGINPDDLLEKGSCTSDFVMSVTDGRGADIQVEAAGAASQTVSQINRSLSSHGTMIFLGREDSSASVEFDPLVTQANRLVGARGQAGHGIYPNIIRLIAAGVIEPLKLITARYRFDEVLDAFQRSTLRKDGKIMVRIS
jgi:hypothetical protein